MKDRRSPKVKLSRSNLPSLTEIQLRRAILKSDMRVLELTEELRMLKNRSYQLYWDFTRYVQCDIKNPVATLKELNEHDAEVFGGEFDFYY